MVSNPQESSPLAPPFPQRGGTPPQIFDFQEYRKFLSEWFQWKKSVQPHYSGALFAKKAGLNSHTLLGMVIRGERNLSPASIRAFCRAIQLKGAEAAYFEKLVLFNQAKNSDDKAYYFEQLLEASQGQGRQLLTWTHNYASYLSHWYVVAIRELVAVGGFNPDPDWIVQKLKRKITRKQAEEAWKVLGELKLVQRDEATGEWKIVHPVVEIDSGAVDFAVRNFNKEYLELSRAAIDGEPLHEREITTLTLAIDPKNLPRILARITEFRKQLNLEFSLMEKAPGKVIAINTQLLVLSE